MKQLREHIVPLLMIVLATLVMTYPTIGYVLDSNTIYISQDEDVYMKFWDAWYWGEILAGRQDYYYASNMFYPQGVDLSYHSFNVVHMILMQIMTPLLGVWSAYHAVFLLMLMLTSISGYLYLYYLFQDKYAALLGAIFFGLTLFTMQHVGHPDLGFLAPIPIVLYFTERAMRENHYAGIVIAGFISGLTIFIGMYLYISLLITVAIRVLYVLMSSGGYKDARVWRNLVLIGGIAGAVSLIRVYPMLTGDLQFALDKDSAWYSERYSDLLAYFINSRNAIYKSVSRAFDVPIFQYGLLSYLGYSAMFLSVVGLFHKDYRRKVSIWFLLFAIFFVLRLGPVLVFNTVAYRDIVLPKKFLDDLLPFLFGGVHFSGHFHIGIGLPLAVMSAFGALAMFDYLKRIPKSLVIAGFVGFFMFETYAPIKMIEIEPEALAFHEQLAASGDVSGALINLPMGRVESKLYEFYQTVNQRPQVEGLVSRTPSNAYDYISANSVLAAWQNNEFVSCSQQFFYFYRDVTRLRDDGIQFVVFHKTLYEDEPYTVFNHLPAYYENEYIRVYELDTLLDDCPVVDVRPELLGESMQIRYGDYRVLDLHKVLIDVDGDDLVFTFLWERWGEALQEQLSVSLQILDADGNKVEQMDYYLPLESVDVRSLSVENLQPGAYVVKMVVYDHTTGERQMFMIADDNQSNEILIIYEFEK